MSPSQLEAIIGHEISHIANGDMVTMTLLQGVVNAFVMFLARILAFALSGLGRNQKEGSSSHGSYLSYSLFVFLFEVVFMIFGSMVIAYYSRRREFRADHGGAKLSSKGRMISALQQLEQEHIRMKEALKTPALQAFMINTPKKTNLLFLFASHPPIEKRIQRLQESQELV
jgi:heat shock protein HtpX